MEVSICNTWFLALFNNQVYVLFDAHPKVNVAVDARRNQLLDRMKEEQVLAEVKSVRSSKSGGSTPGGGGRPELPRT